MNRAELIENFRAEKDDLILCRTLIFSSDMWLLEDLNFDDPEQSYIEIKQFFAEQLNLSRDDVAIVGTAKTGISLSPFKNFKTFDHENSDIDLVIVDPDLFEQFWKELFRLFYTRSYIKAEFQKEVFLKYVSIERDISLPSALLKTWHQHMDNSKREFFSRFRIPMAIKYRIYQNWEAVESYHARGLRKIRPMLERLADADAE
jgi:hypothetical protein